MHRKTQMVTLVLLLTALISCFMITGCGHKLSGEYADNETYGVGFKFFTNGDCLMFTTSRDDPWNGTYYWNSQDDCYHIETEEKTTKVSGTDWEKEIKQQFSFDFVMDGNKMIMVGDNLNGAVLKKGKFEEDNATRAKAPAETIKQHNESVETVPNAIEDAINGN